MADIRKLPKKISDLLGNYDKNLIQRQKLGCLGETELACYNRFYDDLKASTNSDFQYEFDATEVKRVLTMASLLTLFDDKGNRQSVKLYPVQIFIVANLFGWRNKDSGLLRYREAYIQIARRNGKSWLCSILMHYFCTFSKFRSERGICFSIKLQSAMIAFRQFCQFLDADKDLADLYNCSKSKGTAISLGTDNYIEAFTGSKDADGFQSGFALADEVALQDGELFRLIADGQQNLAQAQLVGITTAGFNIGGWAHKRYKAFKKELKLHKLPDSFFLFITEPDDDDDIADWHTWAKANPVLFFTLDGKLKQDKVDLYSTEYQRANKHGGKEINSFITKQCNLWNAKADTLLCDFNKLESSRFDFTFKDVMEHYKNWYLGIDLAQVLDLNSVCWCTWIWTDKQGNLLPDDAHEDAQQRLYINVINYMPSATLTNHIQTDKFQYNRYVGKELILTVGGKGLRTDYGEIYEHINSVAEINGLRYITIAVDPYGCATIQSKLEQICENFIIQNQHRRALSPYIESFGALVSSDEIALSKDSSDIFMRAVTNSIVETSDDGYLTVSKPISAASNYRIDPVDAVVDGIISPLIERNREETNTEQVFDDWISIYN